jgi:hypothetical protein
MDHYAGQASLGEMNRGKKMGHNYSAQMRVPASHSDLIEYIYTKMLWWQISERLSS